MGPGPVFGAGPGDLSIGFVGTLTGAGANVSQDQLDGFKLGVKHLGGRLGGVEFDLAVVDDRRDPALAERGLRQLLDHSRVQVVLMSSEGASEKMAVMANSARSFMIALRPPPPALAGKGCLPNFFSLAPLAETVHAMAGLYLHNQGFRSIVVVLPDNAKARQGLADFQKVYHGQVLPVVSRPGTMNFAKDLDRVVKLDPDGVYLLHSGGMAVNFIIQFQAAKMKARFPLFGPSGIVDQTAISAAGGAAADLFSVAPWSDDMDTASNRRLMADFEVEYGRPASVFAAYGYDAAMLLDRAVTLAEKRFNDDDAMRAAMRRADFVATRPGLRFDTNHMPIESFVVRQVVPDNVRGRLANEQRGLLARDVRDGHAGACPMRWTPEPPAPGAR